MFANYLKITLRALWRRKFTTGLNILGLVLGLTVFLFLMEFAGFHAGFDSFNINEQRIYRIVGTSKNGPWNNVSPQALSERDRYPSIEAVATFMTSAAGIVTYKPEISSNTSQTRAFREKEIAYANNDVFKTFTLPLLAGSVDLDQPNTVVISASAAQKYFLCGENYGGVIGKRLLLSNQFTPVEYIVTGVMAEMPLHAHLRGTMLFSLQTLANPANLGGNESWARLTPDNGSAFLSAYLLLKEGANAQELEQQINARVKQFPDNQGVEWHLQPLRFIHTGHGFNDPLPNDAAYKYVVVAFSIALFVLALAWINYVNLSTAFGLSRAREIGVRKTIGASRMNVAVPHLLECAVLSLIALLLAFGLVELFQHSFNTLVGAKLSLQYAFGQSITTWGFGAVVLASLASGGYVAFALTAVKPIIVLRGNFARSQKGSSIRKILVVTQFAVSIMFIVGTFVMLRQLDFMRNKDLGMKLEQLVIIDGPELLDDEIPGAEQRMNGALAFKQEGAHLSFVKNVAGSQNIPGESYNFSTEGIMRPTGQKGDEKKRYNMLLTDEQFFTTYGMSFAAGQGFKTSDNLGDFKFRNVVINEAAAIQLGFQSPSEAIGEYIQWGLPPKGQRFQVAGVVKNYHHKSLRDVIEPIIFLPSEATAYFSLRISGDNIQANVAALEQLYKRVLPGNPFTARFADELFQKQYESETRIGNVFTLFSFIAIGIACLGLLGLAAFAAESRMKEIGVRKVLGATEASIIGLLSKDFLKLVGVAFVIACPAAYYLMNAWLQDFAYRVELRSLNGLGMFVLAGVVAFGIAFMTVAGQASRAARANAIDSLRCE